MDVLHREVSRFLARHRVPRSAPLLVAVSGGADSVALAHVLLALGQRLGIAHVHHGLRGPEADADLEFVRTLASAAGVPFHPARVDARRRDGRSPEARARELRYEALRRLCRELGYSRIVTAHTEDDQAETLLLRAVRGSGPIGLGSIAPETSELLRPLLRARHQDLVSYLSSRGLRWREDATNRDLSVPRNRLRADVLPVLEQLHPGSTRKLAELADAARELGEWVDRTLEAPLAGATEAADGGLWIDRARLVALPAGLRLRALASLLESAGLGGRVTRRHLERLDRFLADAPAGKVLSLPHDRALFADRAQLWLGPAPGPRFPAPFRQPLRPAQTLELPRRDTRLVWRRHRLAPGSATAPGSDALVVPDSLAGALVARSPRADDRLRRPGEERGRALEELSAAARWSRRQRAYAVLIECREEPIWMVGLPPPRALARRDEGAWELAAERLSAAARTC
jgi:tRNA(Ile)-lysidine synthase